MDDFSYVLRDALEYYDSNNLKNFDLMRSFKFYKLDLNKATITFYDKKKKEIMTYGYNYIGKYSFKNHLWIWGWSVSDANKTLIDISRRVLNYALDLDSKHIQLKSELITSRHQVTTQTQIEILVALTAYLSKCPLICKLGYNEILGTKSDMYPVIADQHTDMTFYIALS